MTTERIHQPTAEFRDYLEHEITREFRHHRSFARLRLTAVVMGTIAAVTTAGLASAQIRQGAQRDSLLETALSDMSLLGLRLEMTKKRLEDVTARFRVGAVGPTALAEAESELRQMEAMAARTKLNVDEIRASSLPPRDDLNAPRVGDRDFVMERLKIDLFLAQQRLTAAEQALAESERQSRVGTVSDLAVVDAGLKVIKERAALGTLAERQKLRKEFIEQGTAGEQLNRRFQHAQVRFDAFVAQETVNVLRRRLDAVQKQHAVGTASELELLRAEYELKEKEYELQMLARQLRELAKPG
jgi:outer membrane protein TolC